MMFKIEEANNFVYTYDDDKLHEMYKEMKDDLLKLAEFDRLLHLRRFFRQEIVLNQDILSTYAYESKTVLHILSEHLKIIDSNHPLFMLIIKSISLLPPITTNRFEKNILHISDLHFGNHHKYYDDKFIHLPADDRPTLFKDLVGDLSSLKLEDKINFVVISGDLTWESDPNGYEEALDFLNMLSGTLSLPKEKFIVVPGNHDIKWEINPSKGLIPSKDSGINYKNFIRTFYSKEPDTLFSTISNDENIIIIGLNSARLETTANGVGYVGETQIKNKILKVENITNHESLIKIAVLHHHLIPVSHIEMLPMEFHKHISMTLDADAIIRKLIKHNFKMVLHGHKHKPFYAVERRFDSEDEICKKNIILCGAGSASLCVKDIDSFSRNQYNLITVTDMGVIIKSRMSKGSGDGFRQHITYKEKWT